MVSFAKQKAVFMSLIIILSMFWVSLLSEETWAQEKKCCEQTFSGANCVYTEATNCDPQYRSASTTCEQTSFCNRGCCYEGDQQTCFKNVPEAVCELKNGTFSNDPNCNIPQCQLNCCVLGSECAYTTESQCQTLFSSFPNAPLDYRSVSGEAQCLSVCQLKDEGCCRSNDETCAFTTRENCPGGEFLKGKFCSDTATGCSCTRQFKKGCVGEDAYWFDSCGNKEGIAEDCDYVSGTKCKESNGTVRCASLDCPDTYNPIKNNHDPRMGGPRKNGESWCVYESGTGDNLDRPGTRHYRHICFEGEEILEECRDYREEVCLQGEIEAARGTFSESNCVINNPPKTAVPIGLRFWEPEAKEICNVGSFKTTVVEVKKHHFDDWDCEVNCHVLKWGFAEKAAEFCKSIGDCGADYNVLDARSQWGFSIKDDGKSWKDKSPAWWSQVNERQWQDWARIGVYGKMKNLSLDYISSSHVLWEEAVQGMLNRPGESIVTASAVVAIFVTVLVILDAMELLDAAGKLFKFMQFFTNLSTVSGPWGWVILAVMLIFGKEKIGELLASLLGGKQRVHKITVTCDPWLPPLSGKDCGKCNEEFKVCSEYKCKSLGTACMFINEGTGNETCVSSDPNDVNAPIIIAWPEILTAGYSLSPLQNGYRINGKVRPYEQFSFGVHTNEPAQCKIGEDFPTTYDAMPSVYLGDYLFKKDHSETSRFESNKTYRLYVMCSDVLGNKNSVPYQISFETEKGPDLTPPIIIEADPVNNAAIPNNIKLLAFSIYVNEPSYCNFDIEDTEYNLMEDSMDCSNEPTSNGIYTCSAGINLTKSETYYVRCMDLSNNTNTESYIYKLRPTNKLNINYIEPASGTVYYTNDISLKVGTFGGVGNGVSLCSFSENGRPYVQFFETNSSLHRQEFIELPKGNYDFAIRCADYAGNMAENATTFRVDVDINAPKVIAIYTTAQLNILFDESATCQYSNTTFAFGSGIDTTGQGTKQHSMPMIQGSAYHVICKDSFNNLMPEIVIQL